MKTGTCKLCKRERQELQDSHLMPQGMYKRIRSEKETNPHPILIDRTGSRPMSDQITDFVFCKECESRFDKFGENYALRMAAFRERFRLQEELEAAVPTFHKNEVRAYAAAQTLSIKRDELAYFVLERILASIGPYVAASHRWREAGKDRSRRNKQRGAPTLSNERDRGAEEPFHVLRCLHGQNEPKIVAYAQFRA